MNAIDLKDLSPDKIKAEKWFRGDISWKLHAAQRHLNKVFNDVITQLFVANCSRQWGKSFWAVTKAVETALKTEKAQIRYGAAFQSDLVDFIIPAFDKILEDCPEKIKGKYKSSGTSFVFPNGSRIKLVGLDKNPNGLRGNTLDLVVIDECGFVGNLDYIYKSIIMPATLHRPNCKIILISTPPATPAHPFMNYVQKGETEGGYVKLDIYTNPLITEDDIDRLAHEMGGVDSTTFRREALCEFVTDSDLAIIPEWKRDYVRPVVRDEYYKYYDKYVGMDLGVKDLTAMIYGHYDFRRATLFIEAEDEMSGAQMNTLLLVNAIREKEKALWADFPSVVDGRSVPYRRIADNNWPLLIMDLSSIHNLTFVSTDKDNLEAMINEVRLMVQSGQIVVDPSCVKMSGALEYGVWEEKKKNFARSDVYGHFDHLAALVYLVRNLSKTTNPIPATHGHDLTRAWTMHVRDQNTKNAKTVAESLGLNKKTNHMDLVFKTRRRL